MNDYKGSVAEQDVSIQTAIAMSTVIGGNFFESILYVTDRFESFGGDTPTYPVVTKDSYSDVLDKYAYFSATEKKIVKNNLASLYSYGKAKYNYNLAINLEGLVDAILEKIGISGEDWH